MFDLTRRAMLQGIMVVTGSLILPKSVQTINDIMTIDKYGHGMSMNIPVDLLKEDRTLVDFYMKKLIQNAGNYLPDNLRIAVGHGDIFQGKSNLYEPAEDMLPFYWYTNSAIVNGQVMIGDKVSIFRVGSV